MSTVLSSCYQQFHGMLIPIKLRLPDSLVGATGTNDASTVLYCYISYLVASSTFYSSTGARIASHNRASKVESSALWWRARAPCPTGAVPPSSRGVAQARGDGARLCRGEGATLSSSVSTLGPWESERPGFCAVLHCGMR